MAFRMYAFLTRHAPHKDNVVAQDNLNHVKEMGRRRSQFCKERGIQADTRVGNGKFIYTSPQQRAVDTIRAERDGLYGEPPNVNSDGVDDFVRNPAFGDISNGCFPLSSGQKDRLRALASELKRSPEQVLVEHPEFSEITKLRAAEAAGAFQGAMLAEASIRKSEGSVPLVVDFVGHGGRWEPMIAVLLGKPINQPPFYMLMMSLALLTCDVNPEAGVVKVIEAEYLGDLADYAKKEVSCPEPGPDQ